jgi:gamma-glutamylcyclotransferase (GGCT)/AIG2-like uncharacterized protein YtfP
MTITTTNLFVYGSLRSGFRNAAYSYLSKYFHLVGQGYVKGKLYDTGNFPVAISTTENHYLVGELYSINNPIEFEWAISQLDDYEGIATEGDEQPLYKREIATISCNHEQTTAWVYWYNADVSQLPEIQSGDLMEYLSRKK